jgi:hypothetical protein
MNDIRIICKCGHEASASDSETELLGCERCGRVGCWVLQSSPGTFDHWWHEIGSGLTKSDDEDNETHARRVAYVAWEAAGPQKVAFYHAPSGGRTVHDLTPAMRESAIRDALIKLGWSPPVDATLKYRARLQAAMLDDSRHAQGAGGDMIPSPGNQLSERTMSQWQPIETLPAHKQRVLVCFCDDTHRRVWHFDNSACQVATFHDRGHKQHFTLYCESVNGYLSLDIESTAITHWMPLPEPPEET